MIQPIGFVTEYANVRCVKCLLFNRGSYSNFPYQIVKVCLVLHWNSCWEKWQKDNMHGCMISLVYCHKTCMCDTVISAEHSTIFLNDLTWITIKWARQVRRIILPNQLLRLLDQAILVILNHEDEETIYIHLYICKCG